MYKHKEGAVRPIRGRVVSLSRDLSTAKVGIDRIVKHGLYQKRISLTTHVLADVRGREDVRVGCAVDIIPCKKVSKRKSWRVVASMEVSS